LEEEASMSTWTTNRWKKVHKCARSRTGRGVRIGGGRPRKVTGESFGGSLSAELDAYRKKQQGGIFKIKAPSKKQLQKAAQVGKMVADTGAQLYGYDSALDAGISQGQQALADRGYDNKLTKGAVRLAKKQGDKLIDQQLGGQFTRAAPIQAGTRSLGGAIKWKKVGKTALKVGKIANKFTKDVTGQSLTDIGISMAMEPISAVDPSGGILSDYAEAKLQKEANRQLDKHGGSFVKQGQGVGVTGSSKGMPLVRSKYQDSIENPNRWVSVRRMQL
jgi:hypothetical protein